jgi:aspartyl-tRNA(Asn)/glutamyl-tRNA(Gln) amidotransferase subunit A
MTQVTAQVTAQSTQQALCDLSTDELIRAYKAKQLSPVEVAQSCFDRMGEWEGKINAMYITHRTQALEQAKLSAARWAAGTPKSAIDGVPVTLKENLYTVGDPAPVGTAATPLIPKTEDSPVAARAREAGLVMLGKTTMPDFGMLSSGNSSIHGITRSPWRRDRNTSGSSSGAAAAATAGYGPLHVGTDIGGSVRLPATHCGLFALKPSFGRIPINPPFLGRVAGPMTRTVLDSAHLMTIITKPDVRDYTSLPFHDVDYAQAIANASPESFKGLRIGYLTDMGTGLAVHPEVASAVAGAAKALAAAGARVEPMQTYLTAEMLEGMCQFFEVRSFADVSKMPLPQQAKIHPFVHTWCTYRAASFSGGQTMAAYNFVQAMREAATLAVSKFDYVLSPVSPIPAYEAELPSPNNDPKNALPHIAFTVAYNMSEHPASSTNWSYTKDGLPIGVQLVGQRFDDVGVLRLSRALELMRPQQKAWPIPW